MTDFEIGWDNVPNAGVRSPAERLAKTGEEREASVTADRQQAIARAVEEAVEAVRPGLDKIPDPVEPVGDGDLTPEEQERFALCNQGIELHDTAWFMLGKSLDTIATGKLFRRTRHKLEPERLYKTIEEWAEVEKGISVSRCSQLRASWEIGEVLKARGYDSNPGQIRELVPVKNAYGLNASVAVYVLVADTVGADKVTADRLKQTVKLLPGDLQVQDDDDPEVLAKTIQGVLLGTALPAPAPAVPPAVRRAADRRAIDLANVLNRGRIPRTEVERALLEAFADQEDSTVYDAVLTRLKKAAKQ